MAAISKIQWGSECRAPKYRIHVFARQVIVQFPYDFCSLFFIHYSSLDYYMNVKSLEQKECNPILIEASIYYILRIQTVLDLFLC